MNIHVTNKCGEEGIAVARHYADRIGSILFGTQS